MSFMSAWEKSFAVLFSMQVKYFGYDLWDKFNLIAIKLQKNNFKTKNKSPLIALL